MPLSFSEIVKIIDIDPYNTSNPELDNFRFRVEILQRNDTKKFFALIYRRDTFRIQATFPQSNGMPKIENIGDHELMTLDNFMGAEDYFGNSCEEVLEKIEVALNKIFYAN